VLAAYEKVRQEAGTGRREWYEDGGFDLVVWRGAGGELEGFQLLYHGDDGERALTWRPGLGFNHSRVDDGTATPLKNLTPILVPDGAVPWEMLRAEFAARSGQLDAGLRALVLQRLEARG